jgi:cytosine/adenosine deaminase-related metal-dependent hydrolase
LLEELHLVSELSGLEDAVLESLVTRDNARLLRLSDRGSLRVGFRADILVLPARLPLSSASRADVRLVLKDGTVQFGDKDCAESCAPSAHWVEVRVDDKPKILNRRVARILSDARAREDGLALPNTTSWRAA